jgi:fused signal recognition particle receptor
MRTSFLSGIARLVTRPLPDFKMVVESDGKNERGLWRRLRDGLAKTRAQLAEGVGTLVLGKKAIDDEVLERLETALLITDVGVDATRAVTDALTKRVKRRQLSDTVALHAALREELRALLAPVSRPFTVGKARPYVVFVVGVNGAGKTTTIGKLALRLRRQKLSVMLAAGDTFRAAAVEQLATWAERNDVPMIAQHQGADSASVVFDAVQAARSRNIDVLIADTAGRLQAKTHLMEELAKIKRVVGRLDAGAPHEVILVLDGGTGQNALSQVKEFDAAVGLTGLVITKLDGTAKAGVLFAIARLAAERGVSLPVYFVGVGEGIEDLRPFDPDAFVAALLENGEA